jgi:DNA-directed RNA polymerase specialized sigma subunit
MLKLDDKDINRYCMESQCGNKASERILAQWCILMARRIAQRYSRSLRDDLEGEGLTVFRKCVETFDPEIGLFRHFFSLSAQRKMSKYVKNYYAHSVSLDEEKMTGKEDDLDCQMHEIVGKMNSLQKTLISNPNLNTVSRKLGIKKKKAQEMLEHMYQIAKDSLK